MIKYDIIVSIEESSRKYFTSLDGIDEFTTLKKLAKNYYCFQKEFLFLSIKIIKK